MRRFLAMVSCVTLAGLFYVYEEVEAVKIGYAIRRQEGIKTQLLDRGRALEYTIAHLKAPDNLERKLLDRHILLKPPRQWETIVVAGSGVRGPAGAVKASLTAPSFFTRFFLGTAQAEAKESLT